MKTSVDPRLARSRKAMLDAARDLLLREGPAAVTHQRVARQAGVGRATAYRHWPRPEQLMLDTMALVDIPFFREPVTPVRPWLRRELRILADEMALPAVAGVALAMMQSSAHSLPAEVRDRFTATAADRIRAALALAVAEGELTAAADPQDANALLVGPLLQRTCMQGGTVSDELLDRLIDSIGTWHPGGTGNGPASLGLGDLLGMRCETIRPLRNARTAPTMSRPSGSSPIDCSRSRLSTHDQTGHVAASSSNAQMTVAGASDLAVTSYLCLLEDKSPLSCPV